MTITGELPISTCTSTADGEMWADQAKIDWERNIVSIHAGLASGGRGEGNVRQTIAKYLIWNFVAYQR